MANPGSEKKFTPNKYPIFIFLIPILLSLLLLIGALFFSGKADKSQNLKRNNNTSEASLNTSTEVSGNDNDHASLQVDETSSTYKFDYQQYLSDIAHLTDDFDSEKNNGQSSYTSNSSSQIKRSSFYFDGEGPATTGTSASNANTTITSSPNINDNGVRGNVFDNGSSASSNSSSTRKNTSTNRRNVGTRRSGAEISSLEQLGAKDFSGLVLKSTGAEFLSDYKTPGAELPKIKPVGAAGSKLALQGSFNLNMLNPKFSGNSFADLKSDAENTSMKFGAGLTVFYNLSDSWLLSSGLSYQKYGTDFDNGVTVNNNSYKLISLPLMIHKSFGQDKTVFMIGAGLRYNMGYSGEGLTYVSIPSTTDPQIGGFMDQDYYSGSSSIDLGIDLSIRHPLSDKLYLGAGVDSFFATKNWVKTGLYAMNPNMLHFSLKLGTRL